jgi:hypothetical protein
MIWRWISFEPPSIEALRRLRYVGVASAAHSGTLADPLANESGPARSTASSETACWSSVPFSLSTDEAGCGLPSAECATTRRAVSSRASSSFSSSTKRAATNGSSRAASSSACCLSCASDRFVAPTGATPTRSLPSRNFA